MIKIGGSGYKSIARSKRRDINNDILLFCQYRYFVPTKIHKIDQHIFVRHCNEAMPNKILWQWHEPLATKTTYQRPTYRGFGLSPVGLQLLGWAFRRRATPF